MAKIDFLKEKAEALYDIKKKNWKLKSSLHYFQIFANRIYPVSSWRNAWIYWKVNWVFKRFIKRTLTDFLLEKRKREEKYFKNYWKWAIKNKNLVKKELKEAKVFLFGSIVAKKQSREATLIY